MPYSAVTQPCPFPFKNGGTFGSTEAVHRTRVSPNSARTDPSAWRVKCGVSRTSRIWSRRRPLGRMRSSVRSEVSRTAYQLASAEAAAALGTVPACRGDARVVAVRRVRGNGSLGELTNDLLDRAAFVACGVGEIGVLDAGPEAVGADQQQVAGLELQARRHAHVRQRHVAA